MLSHATIIQQLGRPLVAERLSVPVVRVARWEARDRIPAEYWPDIEQIARAERVDGVTVGALLLAHRPRKSAAREAVS